MQDEEIIGFDALYASMNLCAKNVRRKANVGRFLMYGMDEILKLQEDLENGTYKARPTSTVKSHTRNHEQPSQRASVTGYTSAL